MPTSYGIRMKARKKSNLKLVLESDACEAKKILEKRLKDRPEFSCVIITELHKLDYPRKIEFHKKSFCLVVILKRFLSIPSLAWLKSEGEKWPNTVLITIPVARNVPVIYAVMGKHKIIETF